MDTVVQSINNECKKVICGRMSDPAIERLISIKFLPTASPDFDAAVGGGLPIGRMTIISGDEDSAKTGFMLNTIGNLMQDENRQDFVAVWLESENSITKDYAVNTFGIDPRRFFFLDMDRMQGGEKSLDDLLELIRSGAVDICVINSLRALVPKKELTKKMDELDVAEAARMNSRFMSKVIPLLSEQDTTLVVIQQRTTNIGGYGGGTVLSGGKRIRYQAMLNVCFRKVSIKEEDPIKAEEGIKISVTIEKNHCNPRIFPYRKFSFYAIFDEGIETILPALTLALEQGIFRRAGAHIYWDDPEKEEPLYHWRSKTDYRDFMKEHPEIFKSLMDKLTFKSEALSTEEVSKLQAEEREEARAAGVDVSEPEDASITQGILDQDVV